MKKTKVTRLKNERAKKGKLLPTLNRAIMSGKGRWRNYETSMQALGEIPPLLDQEIQELEAIIRTFHQDGGTIRREELEGGMVKIVLNFETIRWTVVYGPDQQRKFKAFEDSAEGDSSPKAIRRIIEVMGAHIELPRRKWVRLHLDEIVSYLEDDNVKNSIEHMLDVFSNNDLITFEAAVSTNELFTIDVDEVIRGLT